MLVMAVSVSGCSIFGDAIGAAVFDIAFPPSKGEQHARDKIEYDRTVCAYGSETPPHDRRPGCVNSRTALENYEDFDRYDRQRMKLLQENQNKN